MKSTLVLLLATVLAFAVAGAISDNAGKLLSFLTNDAKKLDLDAGQIFLTEASAAVNEVQSDGTNTHYWSKAAANSTIFDKSKAGADTDGWKWTDSTYIPLVESSRVATFMIIAELVRDGKLSLDDDITTILSTDIFKPSPLNKDNDFKITIRHLLAETSGLEAIYRNPEFTSINQAPDRVLDLLNEVSDVKFMVPPGFTYNQNSIHWILLGSVIEQKTSKNFVDVADEIFTTLGLDCLFLSKTHAGTKDNVWGTDGVVPVGWTTRSGTAKFVDYGFNNADSLVQKGYLSRVVPMTNAMCTVKAIHRMSELLAGQDNAAPHFDEPTRTNLLDVKKYTIVAENAVGGWAHTIGGVRQLAYMNPSIVNPTDKTFPTWVVKVNFEGFQAFSAFSDIAVTLCDRSTSEFDETCGSGSDLAAQPVFTHAANTDSPTLETQIQRNFWIRDIGGNQTIDTTFGNVSLGTNRVYAAWYSFRKAMLLHADAEAAKDIEFLGGKIPFYQEKLVMDRFGQRGVIETVVNPVLGPFVVSEGVATEDNDPKKAYVLVSSKRSILDLQERHMMLAVRTPTADETKRGFKTPVANCFVSSLGTTYYSTEVTGEVPAAIMVTLVMVVGIVLLIAAVIGLTILFVTKKDERKDAQKDSKYFKLEAGLAKRFPTIFDHLDLHVLSAIEVIVSWLAILATIGGFILSYNGTNDLTDPEPSSLGAMMSAVGAALAVIMVLLTLLKLSFFPTKTFVGWHFIVFFVFALIGFGTYEMIQYEMFWTIKV